MFHKKRTGTVANSSYLDSHRFKLHKSHPKHAKLIVHLSTEEMLLVL